MAHNHNHWQLGRTRDFFLFFFLLPNASSSSSGAALQICILCSLAREAHESSKQLLGAEEGDSWKLGRRLWSTAEGAFRDAGTLESPTHTPVRDTTRDSPPHLRQDPFCGLLYLEHVFRPSLGSCQIYSHPKTMNWFYIILSCSSHEGRHQRCFTFPSQYKTTPL